MAIHMTIHRNLKMIMLDERYFEAKELLKLFI